MKHYGDITKINGAEAPVVDIITGGSPCQDLSVAGKRAGLAGERSGLFMEQMRIVKEMRERERATGRTGWMVRPRYMVWENVPGAFSSGNPKGADFAAVIEEIVKVAEPGASLPVCVPNGGWTKSWCYYAEDGSWSVAWRVHDAQFWGVPQRRKRIALVADFGGLSAPEILFERKGLSGDSEQSAETREGVAAADESGAGGTGFGETGIGYWQNGIQTLRAEGENRPSRPSNVIVSVHATKDPIVGDNIAKDHGRPPFVAGFKHKASGTARGIGYEEEKAPSLIAGQESAVYDARGNGGYSLNYQNPIRVSSEIAHTLKAKANCDFREDSETYPVQNSVVRRLTPLECERLQGYPDGWTSLNPISDMSAEDYAFWQNVLFEKNVRSGRIRQNEDGVWEIWRVKKIADPDGGDEEECEWENTHEPYKQKTMKQMIAWYNRSFAGDSDSARYKALGNSIALPFWQWMARRICAQYERPVTMASLFDGIGGFPLVFQRCGAVPVWASEIEEFPIAVTKARFPDENVI